MQWLQALNWKNVYNLNNVRCKATRYFRNKKGEYLRGKLKNLKQTVKT
jgi:hypothetical protein